MRNPLWVLAVDASCSNYRDITSVVEHESGGRLEVLPLAHPDVQRWRAEARLCQKRDVTAPVLLRVGAEDVSAWSGTPMRLQLLRRLGVRRTVGVLVALGQVRHEIRHPAPAVDPKVGAGHRIVQRFGDGAAMAGVILGGGTPAFAEDRRKAAREWVAQNGRRLSESYEELAGYPVEFRRAILDELDAPAKRRLWIAHIENVRQTRTSLTDDQSKVLDEVAELAADESFFAASATGELLKAKVIDAFDEDAAFLLLASLGIADDASASRAPVVL